MEAIFVKKNTKYFKTYVKIKMRDKKKPFFCAKHRPLESRPAIFSANIKI